MEAMFLTGESTFNCHLSLRPQSTHECDSDHLECFQNMIRAVTCEPCIHHSWRSDWPGFRNVARQSWGPTFIVRKFLLTIVNEVVIMILTLIILIFLPTLLEQVGSELAALLLTTYVESGWSAAGLSITG